MLEEYVKLFDMRDKTFVEALRAFLKEFRLPGEVRMNASLLTVIRCRNKTVSKVTAAGPRRPSNVLTYNELAVENCFSACGVCVLLASVFGDHVRCSR